MKKINIIVLFIIIVNLIYSTEEKEKCDIVGTPIISSTPETGAAFGGMGMIFKRR